MENKITYIDSKTRILENQFGIFLQKKRKTTGFRRQNGRNKWRTAKVSLFSFKGNREQLNI